MSKKKYWQKFSDLKKINDQDLEENEFNEELPVESGDGKALINTPASRRDFLKYLGFSTAAAVAAASCENPVRRAIPFLNRPQDIVPGIPE